MSDQTPSPNDADLDRFAGHLAEFSASLNDREQRILWQLLVRGMDPVLRMGFRDAADLLDPEQEAILVALDAEGEAG